MESNRQLASQIETLTNTTTHQVHSSAAQTSAINQNHPQYDKSGYKRQDSEERLKKANSTWGEHKTQYQQRERTEVSTLRIYAITAKIQDTFSVIVRSWMIELKKGWLDQFINQRRVQENR